MKRAVVYDDDITYKLRSQHRGSQDILILEMKDIS